MKQALGLRGELGPQEGADVEGELPGVAAGRTRQVQQDLCLAIAFGQPPGELVHDVGRQVPSVGLAQAAPGEQLARLARILAADDGGKVAAVHRPKAETLPARLDLQRGPILPLRGLCCQVERGEPELELLSAARAVRNDIEPRAKCLLAQGDEPRIAGAQSEQGQILGWRAWLSGGEQRERPVHGV